VNTSLNSLIPCNVTLSLGVYYYITILLFHSYIHIALYAELQTTLCPKKGMGTVTDGRTTKLVSGSIMRS